MTKETKDILNNAITDVGYWQWWDETKCRTPLRMCYITQ